MFFALVAVPPGARRQRVGDVHNFYKAGHAKPAGSGQVVALVPKKVIAEFDPVARQLTVPHRMGRH